MLTFFFLSLIRSILKLQNEKIENFILNYFNLRLCLVAEKMDQIVVGKTKEPIRNRNKNMNFFVVWFLQCVCERKPETPGNLKIHILKYLFVV